MGAINCPDIYIMQLNTEFNLKCLFSATMVSTGPSESKCMVITPIVINFFLETCTIVLSMDRAKISILMKISIRY